MLCFFRNVLLVLFLATVTLIRASADLSQSASVSLAELAATGAYTRGLPEQVRPAARAPLIYFLRSGPKDTIRCLYETNLATGITRKLLSPRDLGASGAGLTSFQLSDDSKEILVPYYGKVFLIKIADRHLLAFSGDGYVQACLSPDGTSIAAVKNSDILVIDVASGHVKFLTRGGSATLTRGLSDYVDLHDFGRLRSFWWSPDSRSIAYAETDSSSVIQSGQKDNFYPGLSQTGVSCPIAGGINPLVRLGVVPASGGKTVWCGYSSKTFPYLIRVDWQQHAPLSAVILSRDQKVEELLSVTPISGAVHVLLKETDPAWVSTATDNRHENSMCTPYWLSDGSGFLWLTEGRGDWQIEIRDWAGSVIRQITPPGLHVRGIDDLNEAQGILTFEASPDARECQLYRTNFRGGVCSPISHSIGEHSAVFSADHKTYSDSFSINDGEQGADIYSAVTGFRLARLPSLAEMPPALPNIRYFKVGSQQGFDAVVILPTVFKKNAHYPVLLVINPVLGENAVTAALRTYCDLSWYADQGYIVVSVDTAGTPDRGRNNEDAVKGDLIDLPLEEQAAALSDLSKKVPEMDMTRVGVLGDGVGGSVAIAAAIRHPSLFACSIAISPLVDWNTVEVGLAERYLDMPKNDSAGYNSSSVIRYAGAAQRPLLLLQDASAGPLEFESSLRLATEIYRSGDPVDFVPIGLGSKKLDKANGVIALHTAILRFVSEELK